VNLELAGREIQDLKTIAQQDGEYIRALARIAEIHDRRLSPLERRGDVVGPRGSVENPPAKRRTRGMRAEYVG
jgi:hypothetical protein